MISDATILGIQFFAALFMGADYLLDSDRRASVNLFIQQVIHPIHEKAGQNFKEILQAEVIQKRTALVSSLLLGGVFVFDIFLLRGLAIFIPPELLTALSVTFLVGFGSVAPRVIVLLGRALIPLAFAGGFSLVTYFLLKCPKGSVFGVGFILLMTSFLCRFLNLP